MIKRLVTLAAISMVLSVVSVIWVGLWCIAKVG